MNYNGKMIRYNGTIEGIKDVSRDFENHIGEYIIRIRSNTLRMGVISGRDLLKDLLDEGFSLKDRCRISGPIREMSLKDMEEQRRNFAYYNAVLHNSEITREDIDKAAERINRKKNN